MAGPVEKYSWGSNEALKLRPTKNIQQFYWPELSLKYIRYLDVVFFLYLLHFIRLCCLQL